MEEEKKEQKNVEDLFDLKDAIEGLSEGFHIAWMEWSKSLVEREENLSKDRVERWKKLWISYEKLSEEEKEKDRVYARLAFVLMSLKGFEKKTEGEKNA